MTLIIVIVVITPRQHLLRHYHEKPLRWHGDRETLHQLRRRLVTDDGTFLDVSLLRKWKENWKLRLDACVLEEEERSPLFLPGSHCQTRPFPARCAVDGAGGRYMAVGHRRGRSPPESLPLPCSSVGDSSSRQTFHCVYIFSIYYLICILLNVNCPPVVIELNIRRPDCSKCTVDNAAERWKCRHMPRPDQNRATLTSVQSSRLWLLSVRGHNPRLRCHQRTQAKLDAPDL